MDFVDDFRRILGNEGAIVKDRDDLYYALLELRNTYTLSVNLMMIAFDAGVFDVLDMADEIDEKFVKNQIENLVDNYGLAEKNAKWTILTCCKVYGEEILNLAVDYGDIEDSNASFQGEYTTGKRNGKNDSYENKAGLPAIDLSQLAKGEKIQKGYAQVDEDAAKSLGIEDITFTLTNDGYGNQERVKIVGEVISDSLKEDVVMFIMIYNDQNEMIGSSFGTKIGKDKCDGFASFSISTYLPKNEPVSKILIRPTMNPAGFW